MQDQNVPNFAVIKGSRITIVKIENGKLTGIATKIAVDLNQNAYF